MTTIQIPTSKEYAVKIGTGLLPLLGQELKSISGGKAVTIVSDSNVWPIYGEVTRSSLENAGFSVFSFVFPSGESHKNSETYLQLLSFLAEKNLTRSDCLVALGGGVVGDLTGFAAATYLRGISYIQVPTTLLAMVDSSVGGKTAIDLPSGKNLAGAFYQPSLVLCDTDTLSTLPKTIFADGCAEIIKYAVLFDPDLFSLLERQALSFQREDVIARCVALKRDVVIQDEFDNGIRQALNLGHTVGHAIEKASHYTISHGKAVAIGMCIIARAARSMGTCDAVSCEKLIALISHFGLPCSVDFSAAELVSYICSDKKRSGQHIALILPATIGCCRAEITPLSKLESIIEAGM